jgi:hypothetical protein
MNPSMASIPKVLFRFWLLLALAISGCASPKYNQDFKPDTDFSQLKTYNWRNMSSEMAGVNSQQLQRLADSQLASQGFTRTETNPEMLLDMTVVARISTGSSTGLGLSIGLPIGRHGSIGLGGGKSVPNDKQEGIIIVDITESLSNNLLWRGSAEGIPMKNFSLQGEQQLAAVLGKLLSQFPPR